MKATLKNVDQHVVELTIEVPAADVAAGIKAAVKRIASQVNVPGFRKGKAPRNVIEMNYGKEAVLNEDYDFLVNQNYTAALQENKIVPVSQPEIEQVQFEEGKDLIFKATVTKRPDVKLGDYKGLDAKKEEAKVTDEQIQDQLKNIAEQQAEMVVADKDAKVEQGDFAVIDFKGTVDGKAFDGGEGKSYPLQIGSGNFIPGFEDQLVGAKAGDDVTVKVTFPEDYFVADLAGKEAEFATHIHDIKRKQLPELNDEFAKANSSYETIAELKADLRKKMEEDAERRAVDAYNGELIKTAVENAEVDIPEVMVADRVEQMIQELAMSMEGRGLKLEDYLKFSNKTVEELREEYKETAAENVRTDLVLDAIAVEEKIEVTPDDMNREIFMMAQNFGANPQEVWDIIAKEGRVSMLAGSVARKKAARFIVDNAKGAEAAK
ncbi:MAG: trigger factor [Veillonella sp.]|nr:trigger factor [Veillonella sp.]